MVQVFGPLPSLLTFRLTEFPPKREGYKKLNFTTGKTIKNHARIYTPGWLKAVLWKKI